jgi:hypothetical protein
MLQLNSPIVLTGMEASGTTCKIAYDMHDSTSSVPTVKEFDFLYNNIPDELEDSRAAAFARLQPFALFLLLDVPDYAIVEYVKNNYQWTSFPHFKNVCEEARNDDGQLFEGRVGWMDYERLLGTCYVQSVAMDGQQIGATLKIAKIIKGQSVTIKTPAINLEHALPEKKRIGVFWYEALHYEMKNMQQVASQYVSRAIHSDQRQLDLFSQGQFQFASADQGEQASDFDDMIVELEQEAASA